MGTRPPWEDFASSGGPPGGDSYETKLSGAEEASFQRWKSRYAPQDSGGDYDLRGAFKAGLKPDPKSGHWPDTFKKPNHPTFSDESIYAKDRPELAGHWEGETYSPPKGGAIAAPWEDYQAPPDEAQLGGSHATMAAGRAEGFWLEKGRMLKEAIFGHPDREDAKATGVAMQPTPYELAKTAATGGAAMLGGSMAGQLAANPIKAGLALAGSYAGEKAGHSAGEVAETVGAPKGTRQVLGVTGAILGGGAGALTKRGATAAGKLLGATEAEVAPAVEAAAGKTAQAAGSPAAAQSAAEEVEAKIVALRKQGLSGAQITSSLRQLFGIPPSAGQKAVEMVLEKYFKVTR